MYALDKGQTDIWPSWLFSPHYFKHGHASETSSPGKVEKGKKDGRVWGAKANQSMSASIHQVTTLKHGSLAGLHNCLPNAAARRELKIILSTCSFCSPRQRSPKRGTQSWLRGTNSDKHRGDHVTPSEPSIYTPVARLILRSLEGAPWELIACMPRRAMSMTGSYGATSGQSTVT